MSLVVRALAMVAVVCGFGCAWFEPEPLEQPRLEFPEPEIDVPLFELADSTLWLARSPIGSFYLFGAVDPERDGGYAVFGPEVESAYEASAEVVREIAFDGVAPERTVALLKRYGTLRRPATLKSRVAQETWALLEARFAESDRSTDAVRAFQPWLVSFALANHASLAAGSDPLPEIATRVQTLAQRARPIDDKPVIGLRSLESLFQSLAKLPRGVQDSLLRSALGAEGHRDPWLTPALAAQPKLPTAERAQLYEHLIF